MNSVFKSKIGCLALLVSVCMLPAIADNGVQNYSWPSSSYEDANPKFNSTQKDTPKTSTAKSKMLFGRIEEIEGSRGAKLPVGLRTQTPKLDNSLKASVSAKTILSREIQSFPSDWQGRWSGYLKVYSDEYSSLCWQNDAAETKKEQEILHPGASGQVTFEFAQSANRVYLQPAQVIFAVPMSSTRYADQITNMFGGMAVDEQSKSAISNMLNSVPVYYSLHLGSLDNGIGVSGNTLQSKLLENKVRELSVGVLEQQVVTYNADKHLQSGQTTYGYSESVVRFYKRTSGQLSVQVAVVNYYADRRFLNKFILTGDVVRN